MSPRAPHRFYYAGQFAQAEPEATLSLDATESHHLFHVLRLREGALIDVFDAAGLACHAELTGRGAEGTAQFRLLAPIEGGEREQPTVNIAIALLKRRAMDLVIEKLTELGVDTIQPLLSQRCVALSDIKPNSDPPDRWFRLSLAAAKQCGANRPLTLLPPARVSDWLGRTRPPAHTVYAHPRNGGKSLGRWLSDRESAGLPIWVAIGPEGGWTQDEEAAFELAGFNPVFLGTNVLRAETAAIACAARCLLH